MTDPARIVLDPTILVGKPVIRGTRLAVDFIIGLMADGWNETDILQQLSRPLTRRPCGLPRLCS